MFVGFALLLVIGIAVLMESVGLSMALGAFLAGVLLADSEYRHELELDIEPFKGLLLGLFFIAVGMSIDLGLFVRVAARSSSASALGIVALKAAILYPIAQPVRLLRPRRRRAVRHRAVAGRRVRLRAVRARRAACSRPRRSRLLNAAVAVSMLTTPLLFIAYERSCAARPARRASPTSSTRRTR